MKRLGYTNVIATFERADSLGRLLTTLANQTRMAAQTIIIDASKDGSTKAVVDAMRGEMDLRYERADIASAAQQRNQGARLAATPLVAFMDDDATVFPETCDKICRVFEDDTGEAIGGVGARMMGEDRPTPRGLLWWYYRIQAGYAHPTYGGKLFGPAINCFPSYTEAASESLIPADWLSCTCVFYRTELFMRERFPLFTGYSFMEDVHLSARISKTHRLFFHTEAQYEHFDAPNSWKRDLAAMARNRMGNQRLVAREILGLNGFELRWKMFLHRLFVTGYIFRQRERGFLRSIAGLWSPSSNSHENPQHLPDKK